MKNNTILAETERLILRRYKVEEFSKHFPMESIEYMQNVTLIIETHGNCLKFLASKEKRT